MSDIPEKIWAVFELHPNKSDPIPYVHASATRTRGTEYTRADIADALTAEVAALKAENERLQRKLMSICLEDAFQSDPNSFDYEYWKEAEAALKEALKGGE